jgi:hypothetical protein
LHLPEIPSGLAQLRDWGFNPKRILDIGAYRGDFARESLDIWPIATVVCFEPLPHSPGFHESDVQVMSSKA